VTPSLPDSRSDTDEYSVGAVGDNVHGNFAEGRISCRTRVSVAPPINEFRIHATL
jgi:hypothetical protein